MYNLTHLTERKISLAQAIDSSKWSKELIELRKESAKNFKYKNYIPVFGWDDKYEFIRNLANNHLDKLVVRYCLYEDPRLEAQKDLENIAERYTGLLHYSNLGLHTTISSLTDTLYAYFMSGELAQDLELKKAENYVLGMVITNNLFRSKLGYGRVIDFKYGHISKQHGYVVNSGCHLSNEVIRRSLASLVQKGYVVRVNDKQHNTAYRYKGMSDVLATLPLDKVIAFKEKYTQSIQDKDTLTPSMKSALSRAMMMHTNSLATSIVELRVLHRLFYSIVHLGNVDTPVSKYSMAKMYDVSRRSIFYAFNSLIEKQLLLPIDNQDYDKFDAKLYDIPIFPFEFKKGDIENFLYDHITEIKQYGEGVAEASSVLLKARDGNYTAVYNSIRNLTKSTDEDATVAVDLDVEVPMSIFDHLKEEKKTNYFERYFQSLVDVARMQKVSQGLTSNPTKLFKTFIFHSQGLKRKDTTVSYSPITCQTLGSHPDNCLAKLKSDVKNGSIQLPTNSITRLLLGVYDLINSEYCSGEPRKIKGIRQSHRIKVGQGSYPTVQMCGLLGRKSQKYKKQILNYTHQYPTEVLANYRLTDIDRVFRFLLNKINTKFLKTPPKVPPTGSEGARAPLTFFGFNTPADSLADLIMCFMSIETNFLDKAGDASIRVPVDRILKEGACAFTKGWYVLPEVDNLTKVRQEVEDMQDLLLTLSKIKCESIQAQKLFGFVDKNNEYNDDDFFLHFGASDQYINNEMYLSDIMGLTVELPVRTSMKMFEKSPMIRSYEYNNDIELRASYAFNYLFNNANYQTFGSLKHNLNKYFNGRYKFVSICNLTDVLDTVKRAIGLRLDKLVDVDFNILDVVDYSEHNRRVYRHYGANLFQTGVKQTISYVFDDILNDLSDLSKHLKTVDDTFEALKTIETGFVNTRMVKPWWKDNIKYKGCDAAVTNTERGIDYGVPSNLMSLLVASARVQLFENNEMGVRYTKVNKELVERLSTKYVRDLSGVALEAQKYIDEHLQDKLISGIVTNKYSHTYLWEMPHVIEKRFEYKPFTNKTLWKRVSKEEDVCQFNSRQWFLRSEQQEKLRTKKRQESSRVQTTLS